jgi:hypothetical protein
MPTLLSGENPRTTDQPNGDQPNGDQPNGDQPSRDPQVTVRVVADGRGRRGLVGSILTTLVVGALAVGVLVIAGVLTGVLNIGNPFGTSTVDRSSPTILRELTDLSQYSAAKGHFQQTVDVEDDVAILPSFVAGERTTFLANGTVDATVDFSALSTGAVQSRGDGGVTITLPEPRLGTAVIDPRTSRVVGRERGLLNRVGGVFSDNPTGEQKLYVLAQDKIGKAAQQSHLGERAERNTTKMLEGFLGRLGYTDVRVVYTSPTAVAASAR